MKTIPYERLDHVISTGRSGKGNNNRYRFNDFSDLKNVKDLFPNLDWARKPKKRKKTHKKTPSKFSSFINCNRTHIIIPCEIEGLKYPEQEIVLLRKVAPNDVLGMYPRVKEIYYSYEGEVFAKEVFKFGNTK